MKRKGVSYDVGRVMGGNWRPVFDPQVVRRELEIIQNDLHCNAVRICGLDIDRLTTAAEQALQLGLEVWLSPEMWDKSQEETLRYITRAAAAAEKLRERWPEKLVFLVGSELTLFMQGIVPGRNITQRMGNPSFWENAKARQAQPAAQCFLDESERSRAAGLSRPGHATPRLCGKRWIGTFSTSWVSTITGPRGSGTGMPTCSNRFSPR